MCGISGFYFFDSKKYPKNSKQLLEKMNFSLKERGPDSQHFFSDEKIGLGFSHTRLAVQDQSEKADQPFFSDDGSISVVFNGQIYNHKEIRKELEEKYNYFFRTKSDTEVLVYAYKKWGINFLEKLDGMFAFCLYDFLKNELFLVRDRIGIKPVYFSASKETISFSSQADSLLNLPWIKKDISSFSSNFFLSYMATPAPLSMYENIFKLPAGFFLKIGSNFKLKAKQWYNVLEKSKKNFFEKDKKKEKLKELFFSAVEKRIQNSDSVPGIFLSGGLDSSLIAAVASKIKPGLKSFSLDLGLEKEEKNSSYWAEKISDIFKTDHEKIVLNKAFFKAQEEKVLSFLDDPVGDPVCTSFYILSKAAKKKGLKVVLTGEGADELFWGYQFYKKHLVLNKITNSWPIKFLFKNFSGILKNFSRIFSNQYRKSLFLKLLRSENLFTSGALVWPETLKENLFSEDLSFQQKKILDLFFPGLKIKNSADFFQSVHKTFENSFSKNNFFSSRLCFIELNFRLPELLLMRCDKMGMKNSLEVRVPFLDHKIVQFALSLSDDEKKIESQFKFLLKDLALELLPKELVFRKKVGFPTLLFSDFYKKEIPKELERKNLSEVEKFVFFRLKKFLNAKKNSDNFSRRARL